MHSNDVRVFSIQDKGEFSVVFEYQSDDFIVRFATILGLHGIHGESASGLR